MHFLNLSNKNIKLGNASETLSCFFFYEKENHVVIIEQKEV